MPDRDDGESSSRPPTTRSVVIGEWTHTTIAHAIPAVGEGIARICLSPRMIASAIAFDSLTELRAIDRLSEVDEDTRPLHAQAPSSDD